MFRAPLLKSPTNQKRYCVTYEVHNGLCKAGPCDANITFHVMQCCLQSAFGESAFGESAFGAGKANLQTEKHVQHDLRCKVMTALPCM